MNFVTYICYDAAWSNVINLFIACVDYDQYDNVPLELESDILRAFITLYTFHNQDEFDFVNKYITYQYF